MTKIKQNKINKGGGVMTQEQLYSNMCLSISKSLNYNRIVYRSAYSKMQAYNNWIKELQKEQRKLREQNKVYSTKRYLYNAKTNKICALTIYTKLPKFRTYKQQVAISFNELEKHLRYKLQNNDYTPVTWLYIDDGKEVV